MAIDLNSNFKENLNRWFRRSIALGLFFILWEVAPRIGWIDAEFVPPLSVALSEMIRLASTGALFIHIWASLQRVLLGFGLAVMIGIPVGFILGGWFPTIRKIFYPLFEIFGQVNPFSLFPLFILLFGIDEATKVAIILWVCIWPILFNTILGVESVNPSLVKAAQAMGASKMTLLFEIILLGSAPAILNGIKSSANVAFLMIVAAEMIGANTGLGFLINFAIANNLVATLFAGVITIAILGVIITQLISAIEREVITWK